MDAYVQSHLTLHSLSPPSLFIDSVLKEPSRPIWASHLRRAAKLLLTVAELAVAVAA